MFFVACNDEQYDMLGKQANFLYGAGLLSEEEYGAMADAISSENVSS